MFIVENKKTYYSCVGSPIVIDYKKSFSKKENARVLHIVGTHNIYDKIQTFKDDNNVYKLLEKYNNDKTKLMQVQKSFVDLSSSPKTLSDMNESISNYINSFASLPADLKSKFGNNAFEFIKELGSNSMLDKVNEFYKSKNLPIDSEVRKVINDNVSNNVEIKEVQENDKE